jgi:hypothetical protein
MALWGLIVASILAIGFLLLFVGLAVTVPILGHSTSRRPCVTLSQWSGNPILTLSRY